MVTKRRPLAKRRPKHLFIVEWMEFRGLGDKEVASRLGVARETVTRWREQQHRLNPEKIARLASVLDCESRELWWPPSRLSIDAILKGQPDEMAQMAADIVRRLVKRD